MFENLDHFEGKCKKIASFRNYHLHKGFYSFYEFQKKIKKHIQNANYMIYMKKKTFQFKKTQKYVSKKL